MTSERIIIQELDGKRVAYSTSTAFVVEVGRGRGRYTVRYRFVGNLVQAVHYFNAINVGNGYKVRLRMEHARRGDILARKFSL